MRIALISDALTLGGAERQILLSAFELEKLGHTVKIIIYHPCVEFQDFIRQHPIDLVEIRSRGPLRLGRIRALAKYLRANNFDVVHAFKGCTPISGSLAAKWAGVKSVFAGFRGIYNEGIVFRLARRLTNRLLTGWIVNSRAIAESVTKVLGIDPERLFVVYNGVDFEALESGLSKDEAKRTFGLSTEELAVTIIARLVPVKNHKLFLDAACIVLNRHRNARFLIAGDGPLRSNLEEQAESLGIRGQVRFLGNRADIADLLAATDVSVLTSGSEGFPNSLLESMCAGVPVVSTGYASVHELMTDGQEGLITRDSDASAVAAQINALLSSPELRTRMGQAGAKTVRERFRARAMAKNLAAVYEQVCHGHGNS